VLADQVHAARCAANQRLDLELLAKLLTQASWLFACHG
jgi:hypothetical protein